MRRVIATFGLVSVSCLSEPISEASASATVENVFVTPSGELVSSRGRHLVRIEASRHHSALKVSVAAATEPVVGLVAISEHAVAAWIEDLVLVFVWGGSTPRVYQFATQAAGPVIGAVATSDGACSRLLVLCEIGVRRLVVCREGVSDAGTRDLPDVASELVSVEAGWAVRMMNGDVMTLEFDV